jgi:hypothetical protein
MSTLPGQVCLPTLFANRSLARLRTDIALFEGVEELRWTGPSAAFDDLAARLDAAQVDSRQRLSSHHKTARSGAGS